MKIIYYLSTCDTCMRILKEIEPAPDFELRDVKKTALSPRELELLKEKAGSYAVLINKRARLYQERNLKEKKLSEEDCRDLILGHYTFLKRPVIINDNEIFIGNSGKTVAAAKDSLKKA